MHSSRSSKSSRSCWTTLPRKRKKKPKWKRRRRKMDCFSPNRRNPSNSPFDKAVMLNPSRQAGALLLPSQSKRKELQATKKWTASTKTSRIL